MDNTSYGADNNLFAASGKLAAALTLQIGSSAAETLEINVSTDITAINTAMTAASGSIASGGTDANGMIDSLNTLLTEVGAARGAMGANINRLNHTINNLANMADNTNAAMGRIMDTDFAAESATMTKNSMLMQSGIAMLKQTSQMSGLAMSLLG
ncbi:A-type flagellin [compost metagenome]